MILDTMLDYYAQAFAKTGDPSASAIMAAQAAAHDAPDDPMWDVERTAEFLNVSTDTVRRMEREEKLVGKRLGGGNSGALRFNPATVRAFAASSDDVKLSLLKDLRKHG